MIRVRRPATREIEAVLGSSAAPFSYPEVGATAKWDSQEVGAALAARYDVDRHEFALGTGRARFERAVGALSSWRHFEIPWLELHGAGAVEPGRVVAVVVRLIGVWFLNPCRVVYANLSSELDSAAFAYGTLRGHAECGEERFSVSFDPMSELVRYRITAFSRPAIAASKLGYPFARRVQRCFAVSSAKALTRAVET